MCLPRNSRVLVSTESIVRERPLEAGAVSASAAAIADCGCVARSADGGREGATHGAAPGPPAEPSEGAVELTEGGARVFVMIANGVGVVVGAPRDGRE